MLILSLHAYARWFPIRCSRTALSEGALRDDRVGVVGVGVLLVRFSKETSVPSAFLTVTALAVACRTNVHEPASRRLAPDIEGVDGVGGGDVKPRLFEACVRVEG